MVPKGLKILIHLLICINISQGKIKHFVITFVFSMVSLVVWMRMAPYAHIFAWFQLTNRFWSLKELCHLKWVQGFKKYLLFPVTVLSVSCLLIRCKILENSEAPILPAAACPSLPLAILDSYHSWTISSTTGFLFISALVMVSLTSKSTKIASIFHLQICYKLGYLLLDWWFRAE